MEFILRYKDLCWSSIESIIPQVNTRVLLLSALGLCSSVFTTPNIKDQSPLWKVGLLANIGPDGSKASGASSGVVIASPSTSDPDYLFAWIRDSSLVFKTIIDLYTSGQDTSLRDHIDNFVASEAIIQQITNPSGSITTGGLGEPKFNIDETAFANPWGRPQRDGPALRSTALIAYANWLLSDNNSSYVTNTLWPIVKLDLDYVATYWNQTTFDLWEEISSSSFFTSAVQHRSLREGVSLGLRIGQSSDVNDWTVQADNILCFLQSFWNPEVTYMTSNTGGGRSGIDANTILASIHTFDPNASCDAATFQPCSDKALASLKVYVDSFRSIYPINGGIPSNAAVATGRYPEDVYFNGNPWYLTTFAVAEQLYDALIVWTTEGSLEISDISLPFFQQFSSSVAPGNYTSSSQTFVSITGAIKTFADGFLAINANYTPSDGSLSEQYDKTYGTPVSAADLTWSYDSALTVFMARNGTIPTSWGARGLVIPSECQSNPGPQVAVTFKVTAYTVFGENIFLTGNTNALMNWSPDKAIPLYPADYPVWSVTISLPASSSIEYKYIRKNNGGVKWESDPNNSLTTPFNGTLSVDDSWR